jgi:hypothetical protein
MQRRQFNITQKIDLDKMILFLINTGINVMELSKQFEKLAGITVQDPIDQEEFKNEWDNLYKLVIEHKLIKQDPKRGKRIIPLEERCMAKRANGGRCTRRRKGDQFCGTHNKSNTLGTVQDTKERGNALEITFTNIEIHGITYFTDTEQYLYLPTDILNSSPCPRIIGRYEFKNGEPYIVN